MRHTGSLSGSNFAGTDIQAAINLERIATYDLTLETSGQTNTEGTLAGSGGSDHTQYDAPATIGR
jgi:hypothetical protein